MYFIVLISVQTDQQLLRYRAYIRPMKPSLAADVSLSFSFSLSSWFFLLQFSTPSRLISDAGTEKLAGVLLISGKTRQVPSRRVTVGGRGSKGLFSPSISLPLSTFSFCTLLSFSLSLELPPCRSSTTSISDSGFTCRNLL